MENIINSITLVEWVILTIALLALFISILAWRRADRTLQAQKKFPATEVVQEKESDQQEELPAVLLAMTADKNEFDQVTLLLSNDGLLAARKIDIAIDKPVSVFDAEGLSGGIEAANVTTSKAIMPRLSVLNTNNILPINEIISGSTVEIPAALTMSHGKICEFPVSLKWKDEKGTSQSKQLILTV